MLEKTMMGLAAALVGMCLLGELAAQEATDELEMGEGVSLSVYNEDFAVIKERRLMEVKPGRQTVKFTDVAAQIDPTSVHFIDLSDPTGTRVVEQNYEFDLVSADALLKKYIDKAIRIVTRDGDLIDGTLLSFDRAQIVLASSDGGIQVVPRARNVKDIQFPELPAGLLTRPTLVWLLDAKGRGNHLLKMAYMTRGFKWRADYTVELAPDERTINLAGWVTVSNNSGSRYADAQLKLVAGDVHRVVEERKIEREMMARTAAPKGGGGGARVVEKTFAEYHMYTVQHRVDLNDRQTKQIEFTQRDRIPVTRKYFFRAGLNRWSARRIENVDVEIHFRNDEKSNLGIPLPKGKVRLFKRDADGQLQMLGQTQIDHTPKDEKMHFAMGKAFDVRGKRKMVALRQPAARVSEEDIEIVLRNHKNEEVTVTVEERMWRRRNWRLIEQSQPGKKKDSRTVTFGVTLPANSERKISYTVRYSW